MISEAIDKVLELQQEATVEVNGVPYWRENRQPVTPPEPAGLTLMTLGGLRDYCLQVGEVKLEDCYLDVGVDSVVLWRKVAEGQFHRRNVARAKLDQAGDMLQPGQWYELEEFLVKLRAQFRESATRDQLLRVLGNVTEEEARTDRDDGFTQTVQSRAGVALADNVPLVNPVLLSPFRTFREVTQPESPFILRVQGGGRKQVALFEADGGAWKLKAVESIREWLTANVPGVTVVG